MIRVTKETNYMLMHINTNDNISVLTMIFGNDLIAMEATQQHNISISTSYEV